MPITLEPEEVKRSSEMDSNKVYPQVKVRAEEIPLPVVLFEEPKSIIPRTIESLSLEGHSSSRSLAKYVMASRRVGENEGTSTLISRPRAVLSSPENDDLIGNQNRKHEGKSPHSKKQSTNKHLGNKEKHNHKNTRVQKSPSRANLINKSGNCIKKKDNLLTK